MGLEQDPKLNNFGSAILLTVETADTVRIYNRNGRLKHKIIKLNCFP